MFFDINSMKLRARSLMRETKPSPNIAGLIMTVLLLAAMIMALIVWPVGLVLYVLLIILESGFCWYCQMIAREERPGLGAIFSVFGNRMATVILSAIVKAIILAIGSILFFIPGIIFSYMLRPLSFIIRDKTETSAFSAISMSIKLMKGHKLELFKIDLSLILWYLLNVITLGIAGIYTKPYLTTIYAEYYDHLIG